MTRAGRRRTAGLVALVVAVVLAFVLGAALTGSGQASSRFALLGKPAPALQGPTLDGGTFNLRSLRGSPVLVNVWASWCAPCRQELPIIRDAGKRWSAKGLHVVTINTRDGSSTARSFLRRVDATHLLTVRDPQGRLAVAWGATGVPETFIVDPRGIVRARWTGPVTTSWLQQQISRWAPT